MHYPGGSMDKPYDKLGLPKGHYHLHRAVLTGLPVSLIADWHRTWAATCVGGGVDRGIFPR